VHVEDSRIPDFVLRHQRTHGALVEFDFYFVDIAPAPILTGLERFHDRVFGLVKVFRGMFVLRRIAAAHVATFEAKSKMNPGVAGL